MKQKYERLTEKDIEDVLSDNTDKFVKPLEYRNFNGKSLPFWKPVSSDAGETEYDYDSYMSKREKALKAKAKTVTPSVVPYSLFQTKGDKVSDKKETDKSVKVTSPKQDSKMVDNTGVVKLDKSPSTKANVVVNHVSKQEVKSNTPEVGFIKPTWFGFDKKAMEKFDVVNDMTEPVIEVKGLKDGDPKVGFIKPKIGFGTTTLKFDNDFTKTKVKVEKASESKKPTVGMIKSKDAFEKQNVPKSK